MQIVNAILNLIIIGFLIANLTLILRTRKLMFELRESNKRIGKALEENSTLVLRMIADLHAVSHPEES